MAPCRICSPQFQPFPSKNSCVLGLPGHASWHNHRAYLRCWEGSLGLLLTSLLWHEMVLHPYALPPGGYFHHLKKTLSISVKKYSSIYVFVAIRAIHFCADFKLDIWISQLLYAHAKGTPNHLECTHDLTQPYFSPYPHTFLLQFGIWIESSIQLN